MAAAARREAALCVEQLRGEKARAEELTKELREAREGVRAKAAQLSLAHAQTEAAAEARETAEDTAALEAQRARAAAFDLEMARAQLGEERSRLKLQSVELANRDAMLQELTEQRATAWAKLGARAEHADELHERLRLAAMAGTEAEAELVRLRARVSELEVAVGAKDEQIELARSKLRTHADDGRASASAAQTLGERAAAMAEELRVKDEQLALLRQSIGVMEEEVAAKEGHASAAAEQLALLQRECAQRDDKILMLTEKVQAAQLEIKVGGSNLGRKNEELRQELAASQQALAAAQKQLEVQLLSAARGIVAVKPGIGGATKAVAGGPDTLGFFHNTALLVKALLSRTQAVSNLPIDELYEHVVSHAVPIEEWPQYILQRYSHSSASL